MTFGIHHLGLTVTNLEEAKTFFVEILEWKVVKEDESYPSVFVSDGSIMLTLWKVQTHVPISFDRKKNIGLHHFAIKVKGESELKVIFDKIDKSRYDIEFPPEHLGTSPHIHFMCIGPSGIRIEFVQIN